jgi:hypothetical protein
MKRLTFSKLIAIAGILTVLFGGNPQSSLPTATTYYVATTGSDGYPGTINAPWRTIQHAVDTVSAGDTVYIRAGTYNERVQATYGNGGGINNGYITYRNYPGETVILDGTGIAISYGGGLFHIWSSNFIQVSGLRVQNSNGAGIYVGSADNVMVENNRTYNTVKSGVGIWDSSHIIVNGNDVELACNPHDGYPQSEEFISIANSSNVEVMNNRAHDGPQGLPVERAGGEGINVKDGSAYVKIHNNTVYNLDKLGFGLDAWTSGVHDVEYFSNIAHNVYYGFIVSSEQGGSVANVKVYNNIAYHNTRAGFSIPWWSGTQDGMKTNIQFVNNTSYANGSGFTITSPQNENVVFRNNILSQNDTNISIISGAISQTTIDHNLFNGDGSAMGTDVVVGDPKFRNADGGDFYLLSDSSAIDAGSPSGAPGNDFVGRMRPQSTGYDIGAYEYQAPLVLNCQISSCYFLPLVSKK